MYHVLNSDFSPAMKMMKMMFFIYDYDEWDHSTHLLRQHIWSTQKSSLCQSTVFGPMHGARKDPWGATFTTASIKIKTSRTLLKNLLPNSSYSFVGLGSGLCYFFTNQLAWSKLAGGWWLQSLRPLCPWCAISKGQREVCQRHLSTCYF